MGQSRTSLNDARRAPGEYRPSVEISRSSWWGVKARVWSAPAFSAAKKTRWSARTLEGRFPPLGPAPRDRRHGVGGRRVCRDFRPTARRFRESLRRPRTPGDGPRSAFAGQMLSQFRNSESSWLSSSLRPRRQGCASGNRKAKSQCARGQGGPQTGESPPTRNPIRPPDVPAIHHTERKQQPGRRIFESNGQLARVRERDPGATRLPAGRARSRLSRRSEKYLGQDLASGCR
jgi:hypothetical protein